jgi:hypothetical protein
MLRVHKMQQEAKHTPILLGQEHEGSLRNVLQGTSEIIISLDFLMPFN